MGEKKNPHSFDEKNLPNHIAIIMDGNGRWAKKRGMPRSFGHKAGAEALKKIAFYCDDIGLKHLTLYAFSTENQKRPAEEISALFKIFDDYINEIFEKASERNIRLKFFGDFSYFPMPMQEKIKKAHKISEEKTGTNINICLNYGGRDEIIRAVQKILKQVKNGMITPDKITEESFSQYLYTKDIPDPDLIIRPSGELRLSNFLTWQSAYSELWFSDVLWPDFTSDHLQAAISDYQKRNRRFGGV